MASVPDENLAETEEPLIVDAYKSFPSFDEWNQAAVDLAAFDQFVGQLAKTRERSTPEILSNAVRTATKWAAANTGAIEGLYDIDRGFTYSIAVSSAAWGDIKNAKGEFVANSIEDAVKAYDFVLDAATGAYPVTQVWIRELHEIVTASQETYSVLTASGMQDQHLPKGVYKSHPNSPLNLTSNVVHGYASPVETAPEMQRLIDELNSENFLNAHPVLQASFAHYAFVCVHPFADGNGRVSRALASTFLYRAPGVPLVIFADQKGDYLDALEYADRGDKSRFIRFVADRAIDTIGMVRSQISSAAVLDVETQMKNLAPLLSGRGGLAHTEIDAIGLRLYDVIDAAFAMQVDRNPLSQGLKAEQFRSVGTVANAPSGYRPVPSRPNNVSLRVSSRSPAKGAAEREYAIAIARQSTVGPDFVCYSKGRVLLEIDLREVHPVVRSALAFRAEAEALRELRELVAQTAKIAEGSLRTAGYIE